jgi:alpha-L-glutamate ligase-like protein
MMEMFSTALKLREIGVLGMNRRNVGYIGRYNERSKYPLVDDKLKSKRIAIKAGVTVPDLIGVIATQHEIEEFCDSLAEASSEADDRGFVIKPARGSGGKGIVVIVAREGDRFLKAGGATIGFEDIRRHLSNTLSGLHSLGGRPDVALIESRIIIDPLFQHVSFEGVPDVRIIVFKGYPVMAMLRLATKVSDGKANLHQGAVGVGLDMGSGRAISAVQFDRWIEKHPDTGATLADIEVPQWRQLVSLAAQCYDVTGLGYLGTDFVMDIEHGPMLLEFNARPGLTIQVANERGLLPRLRKVEALEDDYRSIAERVDFALEHFCHAATA